MVDLFQFDSQSLLLAVFGCVALFLSLSFHQKVCRLRQVSAHVYVNAYDKTFKIFSPYPKPIKIIHSKLLLVLILASFPVLRFFGGIYAVVFFLGFITCILCLGLMMFDAVLEMHKNANIFIEAFENREELGKGDLIVSLFLKKLMSRLSIYYFLLTIMFFGCSMISSHITTAVLLVFSHLVALTTAAALSLGFIAILLPPLVLITVAIVLLKIGGRVKSRIFDFPGSDRFTKLDEDFDQARLEINKKT